jgi:hypothetical protein
VVVEIPIDLIKFAIENNPELPMKVLAEKPMARYFRDNITEHGRGEKEDGLSVLERMLDGIAMDAYESNKKWLEPKEDEVKW